MTHLHITTWVIALLLFLVAAFVLKGGNTKVANILQMVLRLFYIFIIITGIMLFLNVDASTGYHFKMLLGIVTIGLMEMTLIRMKKDKSTVVFWILLFVVLLATIYLGFKLPLGIWLR